MAMESKDKVKMPTLKEEFERRDLNTKSLMNIVKYSLNGIKTYMEEGKSFILYSFAAILEVIFGFIFKVNGLEWILIICMLGVLLSIELLNTGIERACDAITKEYNPLIKAAKDCGSGATFIIFIVMVILNIIIFYPKVVALF